VNIPEHDPQVGHADRSIGRKGRLGFRVNVVMHRCPKIEYQRLAI
jgi:hypothetical protein